MIEKGGRPPSFRFGPNYRGSVIKTFEAVLSVAFLSAIITGLIGVGGGILFITLLIMIAPFSHGSGTMQSIAALAAFYTLTCTLSGTAYYVRHRHYELSSGLYLGAGGLLGAVAGSLLSTHMASSTLQLIFFVLAMAASMLVMIKRSDRAVAVIPLYAVGLAGLAIGFIGGLFGLGAGFLTVPLLVVLRDLDVKSAVGTGLLSGVLIALGSELGKLGTPYLEHPGALLGVGVVSVVGTLIGGSLASRAKPRLLRVAISLMLMGIALKYVVTFVFGVA